MSTMIGEVGTRVRSGREIAGRSLEQMRDRVDPKTMSRVGAVAAVAVVCLAIGTGVWIYRRRRNRPLVVRLREAVTGSMPDVAAGLKSVRS